MNPASLKLNQASNLDNIVLQENSLGFQSRTLTAQGNSTEFGSADSYPVIGVGYLNTGSSSYVLAIKNGKAYGSDYGFLRNGLSFVDRTGAVTISNEASASGDLQRTWKFCVHNNTLIGFGGNYLTGTADAPIKWIGGANNVAALGGSPPSALMGLSANNRVFAARTAAQPSTLFWSSLGNGEDWTGAGSGSTVIGTLNDNEPIQTLAVISSNRMLVFKTSRIYQVDLTAAPFSSTILFDGVGCVGPHSVVVVDGSAYFLTPLRMMKATNGSEIAEFSGNAGDQFFLLFAPYLVHGFHVRTVFENINSANNPACDWIVWSSPINGVASVAWDLRNKTWLKLSTGYKFSSGDIAANGNFVGGWYNKGAVYFPLYGGASGSSGPYKDDTNDGPTINWTWSSGWITPATLDNIYSVDRIIVDADSISGGGTISVQWGFGFKSLSHSITLSLTPDSDSSSTVLRRIFTKGRGNAFKFTLSGDTDTETSAIRVRKIILGGRVSGQLARSAA